jgi:hypothetical protein
VIRYSLYDALAMMGYLAILLWGWKLAVVDNGMFLGWASLFIVYDIVMRQHDR